MTTAPCPGSASTPDAILLLVPQSIRQDLTGNDQERYTIVNCRRSTSSRSNPSISFSAILLLVPQSIRQDLTGNDQERYTTVNCRRSTSSRSNPSISFSERTKDEVTKNAKAKGI
ncbi:hypothetical protein EJB05_50966 [Eragrostis curvula]|uniref:Uncharacterized protein n=1 Tax=Eragrostis curvula TaxID=38414 RepID=A0A5J9SWZ5_9POAL|nr:hypothetical protein EJB05_50966 [Eragrostis curvula]